MPTTRTTALRCLVAAVTLVGTTGPAAAQPDPLLQGAAWRDLVLDELIPAWQVRRPVG